MSVTIVTHRPEGIGRVAAMNLPVIDGVEYVVSWQNHGDAPIPATLTQRRDIRVCRCAATGVSANRNNALDNARGEIVLIGDDDLIYNREALEKVIGVFRSDPTLHYASFRHDGPNKKQYPAESLSINPRPRNFHQTAFEVAFRRCPMTDRLRFSPSFGPGTKRFTAGEDTILAMTARNMGLNCRFFPITIATHPGLTTGFRRVTDAGVTRTKGAAITLEHPVTFLLRLPLAAWRDSRAGRAAFLASLRHLFTGAAMIIIDRPLWHSIRHPNKD